MLYECNEKRVELSKEIRYMQNYIDLEKIRQCENSKIEFEISGNPDHYKIAPLLFVPFLENSFKHGLNARIAGWVKVSLNIHDDHLKFKVSNCNCNYDASKYVSGNRKELGGIGLQNVRRRLELLYPGKHELEIFEEKESFTIILNIDLTTESEKESDTNIVNFRFKKPQLNLIYGNKVSDSR